MRLRQAISGGVCGKETAVRHARTPLLKHHTYTQMKHVMFSRNAGWARPSFAALLLIATQLPAQESADNDTSNDEPVKMSSMVVTGSNLPLAGETPVAPVTVISPADIERTGITND